MAKESGQFKAKDIAGLRNHMVTAIEPTIKRAADGSTIWIMECDCGTRFERSAGQFHKTKSCGCLLKKNSGQYRTLDLTGYQGQSSVALRPTDKRLHTYTVWVMRCLECGEEFETAAYNITKGQAAHRCAAWNAKYRPRVGRPPIPNSGGHVNILYGHYRTSARARGLTFDLTKEQARSLFESDCYYCGAAPSVTYTSVNLAGSYAWNGIDRLDNAKGYTLDNCVPCCTQCNFAKRDMPINEFREWVKRIAAHFPE